MPAMQNHPLIDASDLARHVNDRQWVVVDCRFNLAEPDAGEAAYRRSHIPGARYAHLDHDLARTPGPGEGRHPLPTPADFADRLGAWGIDNDCVVVAYDDSSGAIAARLWWMMLWLGHSESLVLDGGFSAWQALDLPLEQRLPIWTPAQFAPRVDGKGWVSSSEIPALQESGSIVVDARAAARFRGEQEPIDPVAGHVPGAYNWPFSQSLGPTGRFREPADLKRDLTKLLGSRNSKEVIAMCGSGVTACHLLLAMAVAGLGKGRLFAGSWSEWIGDPARPIRTGPDP
jgi:thiosulfate/3-mercaptopyruvate sulfurtransferase